MKKEKGKRNSEKVRASILFAFSLLLFTCDAAVPLSWTVETSRAQPATFEAYQGETLTFEAALQAHGKPLEAPLNYSFYWQTNGMGSTYWESPCTPPIRRFDDSHDSTISNVLFATWHPSMDVGAKVYNCFIGSPSNIYHAAFQLRLRPSPGATPNALPLPTPVIDFAKVRVLNPPWSGGGGGGVDTNTVEWVANYAIVTNPVVAAKLDKSNVVPPSSSADMDQAANAYSTGERLEAVELLAATADDKATELQSSKADCAESGDADEIATLDENGNPTRSGIAKDDVITASLGGTINNNLTVQGRMAANDGLDVLGGIQVTDGLTVENVSDLKYGNGKQIISATDPNFSNEVATVARTVTPPPSPKLRVWDAVRQCWWVGEMVNGVMQWEVE